MTIVGYVDELADSSGLLRDPHALRGRLAADGYLFFRGLLPVEPVRAAGSAVTGRLHEGGWITPAGLPLGPPRGSGPKEALADPAYRRAVLGLAFNRIPYLPELRGLVRGILGPEAFSYPVKVLRTVYPERAGGPAQGRYVHCDYGGAGVQDMLTTWLPLMNIPADLGGLAVMPGGHRQRPHWPRLLKPAARGWATTDYRVGDVIVFHCLTPHAALPNAASALRISGDFRWQAPDRRAPAEFVLGPGGGQRELFSRLLRWQRWWEPVPKGLTLSPKSELVAGPPAESGLFPLHPGWQRWRPPRGEVH